MVLADTFVSAIAASEIGRPDRVSGEAMTSIAPDIKVSPDTIVQSSCVDTGDAIGACNSVFKNPARLDPMVELTRVVQQ
jgi:hypothetical protein